MIYSLQILRVICFLGVFLAHCGFRCFGAAGAWAVSCFFVLSGFLLTVKHADETLQMGCWQFALRHVRKLYPLHVILAFIAMVIYFYGYGLPRGVKEYVDTGLRFVLNLSLLQSWIPKSRYYQSFNNVSWFLSALMFCYFIYPCVHSWIVRLSTTVRKVALALLGVGALMILVACGFYVFGNTLGADWKICTDKSWPTWCTYHLPAYRAGDFLCGCLVGRLFLMRKHSTNMFWFVVWTVASTIGAQWFFITFKGGGFDWCRYTLMMLPSSCMCVYCVACLNSKRLPQTIWGRWFIGLGALSGVAYLSHYIILRLVWIWFGWREPWPAPLSTFMDKCEIATITLTATFVFCWGYKWVASHSSTLCRR